MRADTADRQDFSARLIFLTLLVASIVILGSAFAFQFIGGLQPCELCIWQRYPYAVAIGLTGVGMGLARAGVERRLLTYLLLACALTFLIGAGMGVFHVGVEHKWWQGTTACVGNLSGASGIDDLRERLLKAPVVRCDEPAWSLFGVSMAGYNVLLSLALAAGSLVAARRLMARS